MKTVRPSLAIATGVFALFQFAVGIASLVLCSIAAEFNSWWGVGGSVGAVVAAVTGIVGGFGRIRWMLIFYALFSLISAGFMLATSSLYWQQVNSGAGINVIQQAASALAFITAVFAFFGGIVGFAAAGSRRRDVETHAPAYEVEEKYRVRIIRQNRTVAALSIIVMLISIPALIIAAIEGSTASWWIFGGSVGMLVASIFGMVAGFRARRGMHMLHALTGLTAVAFTLVGCGLFFNAARLGVGLTSFQDAVLSLGFIAAVFEFFSAIVSVATFFQYRRRVLPTAAAYPTATATVVQPTVVVQGEESAWQAPGISPRTVPAQPGQTGMAEARTVTEPVNRFGAAPPVPTVPTRV